MTVPFQPDRKLIHRQPVVSTAVRAVGYDKARALLQVEVIDGSVYDYGGVPQDEYEAFMNAASKGQYYNWVIKRNYPECYRVRDGEGETLAH